MRLSVQTGAGSQEAGDLIQGFRHKGLKRFYEQDIAKGLPADIVPKIARILARLDVATRPQMMDLPDLGLHPLKGKRKGF